MSDNTRQQALDGDGPRGQRTLSGDLATSSKEDTGDATTLEGVQCPECERPMARDGGGWACYNCNIRQEGLDDA